MKACKQELKVVGNDQRSASACLEDADETGSLKEAQGGALGSKPKGITGIPLKVNTESRGAPFSQYCVHISENESTDISVLVSGGSLFEVPWLYYSELEPYRKHSIIVESK